MKKAPKTSKDFMAEISKALQPKKTEKEKDEIRQHKGRIGFENGLDPPRFLSAKAQADRSARNKARQRAEYKRRHFFIIRNLD